MVTFRRSLPFLQIGLIGFVATLQAAMASQACAEAAGKISLPPGFKAELVHEVPAETEGSWVSLTPDDKGRLIRNPRQPAGARDQPHPDPIDPEGDVQIPASPEACRARCHDMPVAIGRADGWNRTCAVQNGKLNHRIQQPQRLIVGDMLLGLRGKDIGQQEVGGDVGHLFVFLGVRFQKVRVTDRPAPRPIRAESW